MNNKQTVTGSGNAPGETFINKPEDMLWLKETHLDKFDIGASKSAMLYGNEDCPERIELFEDGNPSFSDDKRVFSLCDSLEYIELT